MRRVYLLMAMALVSVLVTSCDVLEQVAETERFTQCEFSLTGVRITEISGIDFTKIRSASDLGVGDMMTLGQRVMNGNLPAKMEVDVRARNNNSKSAGIAGMGWKVFLDNTEFVGGQLNRSVQVMPNSAASFPITVEIDLLKMSQNKSLPKLLNMVFGMEDKAKLQEMGLSVQIKPSYKTSSGSVREFPGWVTIRP